MLFLLVKMSKEGEEGNTQRHRWVQYFVKIIIYKGDAILDLEGGDRELWVTTYAKHKSGEKGLLCLYMFLLEFMPMCRCKYMCVACAKKPAIEGSQTFSSVASHPSFQDRIIHWIWSVLTHQDWLVSKPQGDFCLYIRRAGITGTYHCAGISCGFIVLSSGPHAWERAFYLRTEGLSHCHSPACFTNFYLIF